MALGAGSPCGACKFLRRKCTSDCIFAPYLSSDQSAAQFAAIHKVFGASNAAKLLSQVPVHDRSETVITISYEAQSRITDPVYGCVGHIFALQQQVAILQAQFMQVKAQLDYKVAVSRTLVDQWQGNSGTGLLQSYSDMQSANLKRSLDCKDYCSNALLVQQMGCMEDLSIQELSKKKVAHHGLGELQAMAHRMMRR